MSDIKVKVPGMVPETNNFNPSVNNIAKNKGFVNPFFNRGKGFSDLNSACSGLSSTGVEVLPTGDQMGMTLPPSFHPQREEKKQGEGGSLPLANIIIDIGHSTTKNKVVKYYPFDLWELMRHRKDIFSLPLGQIRAIYGDIIKEFHKQFDIDEGEWIYSGYRRRKKTSGNIKLKALKDRKTGSIISMMQ